MRSKTRKAVLAVGNFSLLALLATLLITGWISSAYAATVPLQTMTPIIGEIEKITINNPADVWSGGTMTVGGQVIIIPRNLLINLPNDYQTLQQHYSNAPAACVATGETGLAKSDKCNARTTGAQVTIQANRTDSGNVIAGQVDIFKALETVNGTITFISYADGYFRVNGILNDPTTGVMIRVNDPTSRHTVQKGLGCAAGTPNCSPDTRFHIDPDNYTFNFMTGYPPCIPVTANGLNDPNCPDTNRPPQPLFPGATGPAVTNIPYPSPVPVPDSTHFAPIKLGDRLTATGSFESVGGVTFFSAWSVNVRVDLTTKAGDPTQPDYLFINELGWDGPAYNQARVRGRILVSASDHNAPIDYFTIHYDPVNNAPHELPLYSVVNNVTQGAVIKNGAPTGMFDSMIRMDWIPPIKTAKHFEEPCAALLGAGTIPDASGVPINIASYCSGGVFGGTTTENFNLMAPVPREIMARSRHKFALNPGVIAHDIHGNPAQFGQYKLPTAIEYGAFEDLNLLMFDFPFTFSGTPWLMDRRLSPNGCIGTCENAPQPLDPFPFEGVDPRTVLPTLGLTGIPATTLSLPNPDRMFNFMQPTATPGVFALTGLLTWPPASPPAFSITPVPPLNIFPPIADEDAASTAPGVAVTISVLANDIPVFGTIDPLSVKIATPPASGSAVVNLPAGTITYTPTALATGTVTFSYTVANNFGSASLPGTVNVTILRPPVAVNDSATAPVNTSIPINVVGNDTAGTNIFNLASVNIVSNPSCGTIVNQLNGTVNFTAPATIPAAPGTCSFSYTVSDTSIPAMLSNVATATVAITPARTPVAGSDAASTITGSTIAINVIANDTATAPATINPATLAVTAATGGSAAANSNGTVTYTAPAVAGTYSFTYTVKDNAVSPATSNVATVTVTALAPPTSTIVINGGATLTSSASVTLTLSATSANGTVTQMQFSKDGVNFFPFELFAATRIVTLLPGDGLKTTYVRFKDSAGTVSAPISAGITLDTTKPTGTIAFVTPTPTTSATGTLALTATDANGVTQMQFSKDGVNFFPFEPFAASRTVTLAVGLNTLTVRFKDGAGNVSTPISATITRN